jgi:hypothetical protein
MTDMTSTDMARFHERYDQRQRLLFVAVLCASLVLSAVNFAQTSGAPGAKAAPMLWGFGIVFPPLFIVTWWGVMELIARWRDRRAPPTTAVDVRNGVRLANAGFAYNVAITGALIGSQAIVALAAFGYSGGDWIGRAIALAMGAALIWLGNTWPRFPTPRAPAQKAARVMRINRLWGWLMVIMGLLSVLSALFLPPLVPWVSHHP